MAEALYQPINRLKPVCDAVWIVDGPMLRFGLSWLAMDFPTRMTVIRLEGGRLFLHSPTAPAPDLLRALRGLGRVCWIVGPNALHGHWIADWHDAFPEAAVHLAAGVEERSQGRIDFPYHPLDGEEGQPWGDEIATLLVAGGFMTEAEFFHRPSRTLVLTDLIENFEPEKAGPPWRRWLLRLGGVADPHGSMPRDMRATFLGRKEGLRTAVDRMIGLDPERVILAHGRWYRRDGAAELRRAFDWLA